MVVCNCAGSSVFESDFVYESPGVGNEHVHTKVYESVNGFTVKLSEKEASENLS